MNQKDLIVAILSKKRKVRKRKRNDEYSSDSSSIGDIAFLLLIFFIVTSSFILRQGIFLSLPSKNSSSVKVEKSSIVEVVPQNDGFIVDGNFLDRNNFKNLLTYDYKKMSEIIMLVRMKDDVKYDRLVDTLSVAKEVGIKRISLKGISRN